MIDRDEAHKQLSQTNLGPEALDRSFQHQKLPKLVNLSMNEAREEDEHTLSPNK